MEGWVTKTLAEVALIIMGQSPPSRYYNSEGLGSKFLQGCADFGKKTPNTTVSCSHPNKIAPKGSILFSVRAPVGRINFADYDYCIGRGLSAIVPEKIHPELLFYELEIVRNQYENIVQGSTFTSINSEELKKIKFEIPSSPKEQTAIARILSTVDKAIEQTEQLIAKYRRLKTGLMQDLLTRGIDEYGRIRSETTHRFKDSPLGRIPEEWEVVNLSSLGEILTGNTPSTKKQEYYGDDHLFITPVDIGENVFITQTERKLSKLGFSVSRKILRNAICTVCIGSTIGKIGIATKESASNQQINILIPYDKERAYLYFCSMSLFLPKQLNIEAGLQAVPIVNKNTFSKLKIPLPFHEEEKNKIISAIYSLDLFLSKEKGNLSKLHSLKTALMQDLLSGRVRVPSDMIKRIGEAGEAKTA